MDELLTFTIFAEPAHDLQFESDVVWGYEDGPPWSGWTEASMGKFVGLEGPVEAGRRPDCRLCFRDAPSSNVERTQVVEAVFADRIERYANGARQGAQASADAGTAAREISERSTVAAVSVYAPGADLPSEHQLEAYLIRALGVLSDFLTSLGMGGNDVLLGPVPVTELPGRIPFTASVTHPARRKVRSTRGEVIAHEWRPELLDPPRSKRDVNSAGSLLRAWRAGEEPSFPVFELCHSARREALAGRYAPAVITAGTAVEVLIEIVMKKNWTAVGLPPAELPGALDDDPRTRVQAHLPRVLATAVDIADTSSVPGHWYEDAYRLRNKVAHEGYRPTLAETRAALDATYAFVAFIGSALEARPQTAGRAGKIPTHRALSERYEFLRGA